jgi:hypothetical protein
MSLRLQALFATSKENCDTAPAACEPTPNTAEVWPPPEAAVLEDAIEGCQECIALVDMSGIVTYVNIFGMCKLSLDSRTSSQEVAWSQLWSRKCIDLIDYSLESVRSGRACRIVVHRMGVHGMPEAWDISVSPVFDRNATPTHMFCVCRPLSDVRRSERDEPEMLSRMTVESPRPIRLLGRGE